MKKVLDSNEETLVARDGGALVKITELWDSGGTTRRFVLRRSGRPDESVSRSEGMRRVNKIGQGDLFGGG